MFLTPLVNLISLYPVRYLIVLVVAVYSTGLNGQFVNDDITYFIYNDLLPNLDSTQIGMVFTEPSNYWGELLPIRDYLYIVQYDLFGLNPFGYHLVSLGLYLIILGLIVPILKTTCLANPEEKDQSSQYLFIVAFFAFHPVHVESVAYISGQKDLLYILFSLVCLRLFFCMVTDTSRLNTKNTIFFVLSYYCAFLSKNFAVSTALLLTLSGFLLLYQRREFWTRYLPAWGLINIPACLWFFYSMSFFNEIPIKIELSCYSRIIQAIRIIGRHFMLLVWPEPLSFGYPFMRGAHYDASFFAGLAGLVLLAGIFILSRDFLNRFAVLLIMVYLLPVSQLFVDLLNASIYDRYLFLPVLGVGILLARGGGWLSEKKPRFIVASVSLLLVLLLIAQTLSYIPVYKTDLDVAARWYEEYPAESSSLFNYIVALIEADELETAEEVLHASTLSNQPVWVDGYFRGWLAHKRGDVQQAINLLRIAFLQCVGGGYFPYPGILLADSMVTVGEIQTARQILEQVMGSSIQNPVEYFKAKQRLESLVAK